MHNLLYLAASPLLQVHGVDVRLGSTAQVPAGLPDLQDVVLGNRGDMPLGHAAPAEVTDLARVTTMHEQQLGRAVLGVVGRLLRANGVQVPDMHSAVRRRGRKVHRRVRRPGELQDVVRVALKRVQLGRQLAHVPQRNGLPGQQGASPAHRRLTLSADPVRRRCELLGAKAMALIPSSCAWTCEAGLPELALRVSQLLVS